MFCPYCNKSIFSNQTTCPHCKRTINRRRDDDDSYLGSSLQTPLFSLDDNDRDSDGGTTYDSNDGGGGCGGSDGGCGCD